MVDSSLPRFIDNDGESVALQEQVRTRRLGFPLDPYLLVIIVALLGIGLMMVWSTTFFLDENSSYYFFQQVRSLIIGGVLMFALSMIDYRIFRRLSIPLMALIITLLTGVLILGTTLYGARRSLLNGAIQPSEPAKLVVIIYMSAWLSSKQGKLKNLFYGLIPFAVMVSIIGGLIILEPDISTAALILASTSVMFFLAGADLFQISLVLISVVGAGVTAVLAIPYATIRFQSWLALIQDPVNAQASHSQNVIIAFLNGGLTGVGLGGSYQKFYNLSVPHTDSIFAVLGEELGLLGAGLVVLLFVAFMLRGFRIARNAPDSFGSLLAAGITTSIILEALHNIAVMAAAVPFSGVPLPFISFGGSSLVTVMTGCGFLLSVSRGTARKATEQRTRYTNTVAAASQPIKTSRDPGERVVDLGRRDRRRDVPRVSRR